MEQPAISELQAAVGALAGTKAELLASASRLAAGIEEQRRTIGELKDSTVREGGGGWQAPGERGEQRGRSTEDAWMLVVRRRCERQTPALCGIHRLTRTPRRISPPAPHRDAP
jgi:hypothetical protein